MTPDCELLRRYAEHGDEAAFAEVVNRHVDLVYSAALRLVGGDAHLAQDVAQGVFTALARQARKLSRHASIVGWLYTTTRYTAGNLRREQHRRFAREQEAYAMNQPSQTADVNWDALQPVLDEAVCALGSTDREAVLLRFFQNKSHREVGDAVGLSEEAARKRVDRALEKIRAHFARKGVAVSAGVLAATMVANSVQAAPVGLAENLTGASLAKAGGVAAGSTLLTILFMSTKSKVLLAIASIVIILALFTLNWEQSKQAVEAKNASPARSPNSIDLPHSPAVVVSNNSSAIVTTNSVTKNADDGGNATTVAKSASPIHFASAPANGVAAIMAALEAYKANPRTYTTARGEAIPRPELDNLSLLKVVPEFAFYDVRAADIASGGGLEKAQSSSSLFAIYAPISKTPESLYLSALVQVDPAGKAETATLTEVIYDNDLAKAIEQLTTFEKGQNNTYEVRQLRMRKRGYDSAIIAKAFWFKSNSGGSDLIYTIPSNPRQEQSQLFALKDYLNYLQPIAQQVVSQLPANQSGAVKQTIPPQ